MLVKLEYLISLKNACIFALGQKKLNKHLKYPDHYVTFSSFFY